jgi:hypothetical protein
MTYHAPLDAITSGDPVINWPEHISNQPTTREKNSRKRKDMVVTDDANREEKNEMKRKPEDSIYTCQTNKPSIRGSRMR